MDFRMTIQTGTGKHPVGLRRTPEIIETCIDVSRMKSCVMATLAKLRHTTGQEFPVITPVRGMAGLAVFFNRGMLPEIRTAFFGMALVAEVID